MPVMYASGTQAEKQVGLRQITQNHGGVIFISGDVGVVDASTGVITYPLQTGSPIEADVSDFADVLVCIKY